MRAIGGVLGLVAVLAIAYYTYSVQFSHVEVGMPPAQQIDLVGVRTDLISLAQAERVFLATNGTYGDLEQLQQAGNIGSVRIRRRGYVYEADIDDARHFRIVARPVDSAGAALPVLSIDETMQVSSSVPPVGPGR